MYKTPKYAHSSITRNASLEGESIETKIERVVTNKEPIKDGAPNIYTERKDGVIAAYNIKTDRFEIACEAMDAVTRTEVSKRMERIKEREVIKLPTDSGAEPTQGTN
jgi:hypothetical protein